MSLLHAPVCLATSGTLEYVSRQAFSETMDLDHEATTAAADAAAMSALGIMYLDL